MDWDSVRKQFPVTEEYVYLDLANKCALPVFSASVIADYVAKQVQFGGDKHEWSATLEKARVRFAKLVNCSVDEVAFTKNTSESLNIAASCLPLERGDNVVLNDHEHPNNIYCWLNLEKKGIEVRWAPTVLGEVTMASLEEVVDSSTRVLAISSTTYAPGNRNRIGELAAYCRDRGITTVVDAVQSVGTLDVDVQALGIDVLCTSGHKSLFCPHGVGLFYARTELLREMNPAYVARAGVGMASEIEHEVKEYQLTLSYNAKKFEIGNYNYLGLAVLNRSLDYLLSLGISNIEKRLVDLNMYCSERLKEVGYNVISPSARDKMSSILCFEANDARRLHRQLLEKRIVTTLRRDMIRVSFGIYNNESDVDALIATLETYHA